MTPEHEFQTELKIPKERIAILIGKDGEIKKELEDFTNTKIDVDSKDGDVFIKGNDGLNIFDAKEVITAIGRGFNPKIAFLLLKGDYVFEIINIKDFSTSQTGSARLKGRIIGTEGKTRKLIEEVTESYISVYGKTISIIGQPESANLAKQAVMNLLRGAQHNTVYRWLERKRRALKQREFMEKVGIRKEEDDFE
ncbi:KH domain-containing protein [Candidatus Woesearchaeota archaeon]|nr:KH domain-containing protein [Candidatus Woesearchaeota archaeon]MBW3014157.1 KH domain-containing protein [Candidatus Woesearchaeota archaeon]